jgi:geranylgeranyl diphosphate synthase type 3
VASPVRNVRTIRIIAYIHTDDVTPRHPPVTHKIYGIPQTINTANYVYFLAYQELFPLCRLPPDDDKPRMDSVKNLDQIVTSEFAHNNG